MRKMYRINYVVGEKSASCTVYSYPILDEKNTYFLIRSGNWNKQIKKINIGKIKSIDTDHAEYYVFLTDLKDKDMYINEMVDKVRENALKKAEKFKSIYNNAIHCDAEVVEVEPE